jgi:hypothetical protein
MPGSNAIRTRALTLSGSIWFPVSNSEQTIPSRERQDEGEPEERQCFGAVGELRKPRLPPSGGTRDQTSLRR